MIDYAWRQPETEEDFQRVLKQHALSFLAWRAKSPNRKAQALLRAFQSWWLVKGPTGFRSAADALRYRDEVFAYVASVTEEAS